MAFQYPPSPHTVLPSSPLAFTSTLPQLPDDDENMVSPDTPTQTLHREPIFTAENSNDSAGPLRIKSPRTPRNTARFALPMTAPVPGTSSPRTSRPIMSHPPSWKIGPTDASSTSSTPSSSRSPRLQHGYSPIEHQQAQGPSPILLSTRRRQSRFDPMGREEELDDDGYGELGHRHPLRRVAEEDGKEIAEPVSLPGIKALFGVAGEHPQPPTPSSSTSLYASPSLPSLVPNSPSSSPSTARTSRYSSLTSHRSSTSDIFQLPHLGGWWAPDFDRSSSSSVEASSPRYPPNHRANSYPIAHPFADEHNDKRRRSDQPASRDAEESARLRWQAQSRNASFPTLNSPLSTPGSASGTALRSLLHPPQSASASMSRQSISNGSGFSSPLTPFLEHTPGEFPFEHRKIAPVPSRSASLIGGQLAQSFADLTANERQDRRSPLSHTDMRPPALPDRRMSSLPMPTSMSRESSPRPSLPPLLSHNRLQNDTDDTRRQSVTRPPSPEHRERGGVRRSSLAELIMAKSGDDVAMAKGHFQTVSSNHGAVSASLEKPSISEPVAPLASAPLITGWPIRRVSTDIAMTTSTAAISLNSDGEGLTPPLLRNKKRPSAMATREDDVEMNGENAMRGMEVLAESAARRVEAERDHDDLEGGHGAIIPGGSGVGPKYSCAFCAKTFSRPSSLRIHTYSHTGERPFICEEPTCRRRFSVQSNLKRHAKVHSMPAGSANAVGSSEAARGTNGPLGGGSAVARPIERSHRHPMPGTHPGQGYYRTSPSGNYNSSHPGGPAHGHGPPYDRVGGPGQHETRIHPPPHVGPDGHEDGWEDEEDELEEDELEDDVEEEEPM